MSPRTAAAPSAGRERLRQALDAALLVAGLVAIWQVLYEIAGDVALTAPYATLVNAIALVGNDWFQPHVAATARALAISFAISAAAGVAGGLALGFHRFSGDVAEPILTSLYTIPKITLYPILLLLFGLGLSAKVAFGVIHGIVPIVIFTMSAVRHINPVYIRTARVMRLSPWQLGWTVLLPAVLPEVLTGLRVGFALTLLGVVIGEMFASQHGLGFMIINGINVHDVKTMTAVILLIVVFSAGTNLLLLWLERRVQGR
jgi:NitT/TauT family transport system permease protein